MRNQSRNARTITIQIALISLASLAIAWTPGRASAQYAPSCVDNTQCPQGTLCMNGACVQQGQTYAQPQPYAQPQYQPAYAATPQYGARPTGTPHEVTRPNMGLIISGAVILGVSWISNIVVSMFAGLDPFGSSSSASDWDAFRLSSLIPVAGPWIELAAKPTSFDNDGWAEWLILDGLLQLTGATLLIIGAVTPHTETVYSDRGSDFQLAVVPRVGGNQWGLAAVGTF